MSRLGRRSKKRFFTSLRFVQNDGLGGWGDALSGGVVAKFHWMGYGLLMQRVKAVIFDLGETLLNFERVNVSELLSRGAELTYDYLNEQFGSSGKLPTFGRYRQGQVFSLRWNVLKARIICIAVG